MIASNEHSQNNNAEEIWGRIKVNLLRLASVVKADVCCVYNFANKTMTEIAF